MPFLVTFTTYPNAHFDLIKFFLINVINYAFDYIGNQIVGR
jgi:hypothetical protein